MDVTQLRQRIEDLEDENSKLRDVEDQFWALLKEREELTLLLKERTVGDGAAASKGGTAAKERRAPTAAAAVGPQPGSQAYEQVEAALQECLDLLIARDRGDTQQHLRRGPVAAFLSWLEIEGNRSEVRHMSDDMMHSRGPAGAGSAPASRATARSNAVVDAISPKAAMLSPAERETLVRNIARLESENRQLQEELDRADVSRLQALDDADRLHQHVAALSEKLIAMRDAASAEKAKADKYVASHSALLTARAQLAERDAEIARLRAELEHSRRAESVGGSELAADAARIREELARRTAMSPAARY